MHIFSNEQCWRETNRKRNMPTCFYSDFELRQMMVLTIWCWANTVRTEENRTDDSSSCSYSNTFTWCGRSDSFAFLPFPNDGQWTIQIASVRVSCLLLPKSVSICVEIWPNVNIDRSCNFYPIEKQQFPIRYIPIVVSYIILVACRCAAVPRIYLFFILRAFSFFDFTEKFCSFETRSLSVRLLLPLHF